MTIENRANYLEEKYSDNSYQDLGVCEVGEFICATDQIKQRTDIITIQVDIYKLQNNYYLSTTASR